MTAGADEGDFLDLCEKYMELAEDRRRLLVDGDADRDLDEALAEQIDDLDARQRILMWRILSSDVEGRAEPVNEDQASPVAVGHARATGLRETGGTARGRFAAMTAPLAARWSIFAQR